MKSPLFTLFATLLLASRPAGAASSPVTVTPDVSHPGAAIPADFSGLSFETSLERPGDDGKRYFSADNKPLISVFRTLGIKNLRIGGNTADRADIKAPDNSDIDAVFAFAKAAGARVIYTVRLKQGDPQDAARIVKYIADHYPSLVSCYAIGNEPNAFSHGYTYQAYSADWKKFMTAIVAAVPGAMFCGPSTTPGRADWVRSFIADFGSSGYVAFVTQHDYPGGAGNRVTDPVAGRATLLSADLEKKYETFYQGFVPAALAAKQNYRIEEENNFFNGGAKDVSDTFAAALWGLDYMYWWAQNSALGLNFHTGDNVSAGQRLKVCMYTAYSTATGAAGYVVHPLGYGIKAFDLGAHGRLVPLRLENSGNVNLTAYAVLGDDGTLSITLINKGAGAGVTDATVTIAAGPGYTGGRVISLAIPGGDVSLKSGMTLGGAPIENDGTWAGSWSAINSADGAGHFIVTVPAASAAIIKLK